MENLVQSGASIVVLGKSGNGKTSAMNNIMLQKAERGDPFVYIGVKADVADQLRNPPIFDQVFRVRELRISAFRPTSMADLRVAASYFVEGFCQSFGLQLARSEMYEATDYLLAEIAAYEGNAQEPRNPSPRNVQEHIASRKSKYKSSALAAFEIFIRSLGTVFECSRGYFLDELLLTKRTAIILDDIPDRRVLLWLIYFFINSLFRHLTAHGPNDGSEQFTFVVDDCHVVFSRATERDNLSPISQLLLEFRQAGIRLMAASQYPADVSPALLAQASIVIQVGPLTTVEDMRIVSSCMGMTGSEAMKRLQSLRRQEFIARDPRHPRAFAGRVRDFKKLPGVIITEAERQRLMRPILESLDWRPALSLSEVERAARPESRIQATAAKRAGIELDIETIGRSILDNPYLTVTARTKLLQWSTEKFKKIRAELENRKLVRSIKVPSANGPSSILLEPLPALAEALDVPVPNWGRGSFKHHYGVRSVVENWSRNGFDPVRTEADINGKAVDILGFRDGFAFAAEVSVSLSNCVDNAAKDFEAIPDLHRLIFVAFTASEARQITRMIDAAPELAAYRSRISVELLRRLLPGKDETDG